MKIVKWVVKGFVPGICQQPTTIIWYTRSLSMIVIKRSPRLFYSHMWLGLLRSWVNITTFFGWGGRDYVVSHLNINLTLSSSLYHLSTLPSSSACRETNADMEIVDQTCGACSSNPSRLYSLSQNINPEEITSSFQQENLVVFTKNPKRN